MDDLLDGARIVRGTIELHPEPLDLGRVLRDVVEMHLSVKEHEMHHPARFMIIERLLGIVPHLTRQRLARTAQASSAKPAGA